MESPIKKKIIRALGKVSSLRIFNNPVGLGYCGEPEFQGSTVVIQHARTVKFGLCKGSADLIGARSMTVTPEMVGRRVLVFMALEVKDEGKYAKRNQRDFRDMVLELGGIAAVVRSPAEARAVALAKFIGISEEEKTECKLKTISLPAKRKRNTSPAKST